MLPVALRELGRKAEQRGQKAAATDGPYVSLSHLTHAAVLFNGWNLNQPGTQAVHVRGLLSSSPSPSLLLLLLLPLFSYPAMHAQSEALLLPLRDVAE